MKDAVIAELDLYFARELICGCKPYITRSKPDYTPPRTLLIPWQLPTRDYRDSSVRSSKNQATSYLNETGWNSICYDLQDSGFIIEDKEEKTLED